MRSIDEDRLSMLEKVLYFLDTNMPILTIHVPAILDVQQRLSQKINDVFSASATSTTNTKGFTQVKSDARKELEIAMLKAARSATAYAVYSKQHDIRMSVQFQRSDFERMRDNDLYTTAKIIHDTVTPIIAQLANFAFTATDLDDLNTKRDAYFRVIQLPKLKIGTRTISTKEVGTNIADAMTILRDELDVYMGIVEFHDVGLFTAYETVRAIDQTGSRAAANSIDSTVAAMTTLVVTELEYDAEMTFNIKNTGATPLVFGLSLDKTVFEGTPVTVTKNAEVIVTASDLGTDGTSLLVQNTTAVAGTFKVIIV